MPPEYTAMLALVAGLVVGMVMGVVAASYRSRRDLTVLRMQTDAQLTFATRQYELHLESLRQAHHRRKVEDAYDQLAVWLDMAERTIDEIWFGSFSEEGPMRQRAKEIIERWPWDRRFPPEISPARFYWSSTVREQIRNFNYEMHQLVFKATAALSTNPDNEHTQLQGTDVLKQRGVVLQALDRIRDKVRVELGVSER